MSASPAKVLQSILLDSGLVARPGVRRDSGVEPLPGDRAWAFVNDTADEYERAVLVQDVPGLPGGREQNGGRRHPKPGVMIAVRDFDQPRGYALTVAIALLLNEGIYLTGTEVRDDSGVTEVRTVHSVTVTSGPAYAGVEPNSNRHRWNFSVRLSFPDSETLVA